MEKKEALDGQCLKEKNIDLTRIGEATRNREVWRSLIRASLMEDRKEYLNFNYIAIEL